MKVLLKKSEAQEPFTFSFVDDSGRTVLRSENYAEKRSALNGIESVRRNALEDARYEIKEARNGKLYFNVKASNGQVVGTSVMFDSAEARAEAMAALRAGAADAPLEA